MNKIKKWFKKISWKVVGKFLYKNFLRSYLKEASEKSDNTLDDAVLKELDKAIEGL